MDWIYSYVRYLRVDPYGDYRNRDYVSIYLCLDDNSNMPPIESAIMAEFIISILNQKNGKHSQQKGSSYQLLQFSIALEFDAFRNRVYIYNPFVFCGELPSCISILLSPSLICFCFLFFFFGEPQPAPCFLGKELLGDGTNSFGEIRWRTQMQDLLLDRAGQFKQKSLSSAHPAMHDGELKNLKKNSYISLCISL